MVFGLTFSLPSHGMGTGGGFAVTGNRWWVVRFQNLTLAKATRVGSCPTDEPPGTSARLAATIDPVA